MQFVETGWEEDGNNGDLSAGIREPWKVVDCSRSRSSAEGRV